MSAGPTARAAVSIDVRANPSAKLEKLSLDYEKTKKEIEAKEVRQRQVMSTLFSISKKMKKIVNDQAALNDEKMMLEFSTRSIADRILELENKLKTQKIQLKEKLSAIYKLGGQGIARIIFSSNNSASLERNLKILGIVAENDLDTIKEYVANKAELQSKKEKFVRRLAKLKSVRNKIAAQEARFLDENKSQQKILDDIKKSQAFSISKLSELRDKTSDLGYADSGIFDLLLRPSFFERKGSLPLPVKGNVVKNFGIVKDETHNLSWANKGILLSAPINSPVKTVFNGSVAFAGEIPGLGPTIIVDHGDHYYTIYGNNNSVNVKVGDEVKQGQILALSGYSPDEKINGSYFEIRHFSEPFDPKPWLKGTSL